METRKLGKQTLALEKIDPSNGTRLWRSEDGKAYLQYRGEGQLRKATFTAK